MSAIHLVRPYSNTMLMPLLDVAPIAEQHRAIYEALAAGDQPAAAAALEDHMGTSTRPGAARSRTGGPTTCRSPSCSARPTRPSRRSASASSPRPGSGRRRMTEVRLRGGHATVRADGIEDEVAVEEPLEIRVDGRALA